METKESLFNAGIAKLERIDNLKKQYHIAMILEKDFSKALNCLEQIWEELSERLTDDEAAKVKDRHAQTLLCVGSGRAGMDNNQKRSRLREFSFLLNKIEYKYGLSMPNKPSELLATEV